MGNCQAAEAAEVIIQHPGGKVERLYWPTPAAEVMKTNPGHYVALVILRLSPEDKAAAGDEAAAAAAVAGAGAAAKITRVKLLKPKDVLHLGQVYRLITAQEVTKALRARKNDKMRRCEAIKQQHDQLRRGDGAEQGASDKDANANAKQRGEKDRHRGSGGAQPAGGGRGRHWRLSLQSISEAAAGQSSSASSSISESTAS
ncbi:hypothetical protein CFC21_071497 [Triticum aestivum]|uniref:DUF4228 domain-containing protein n=2 Tax=Triticum aestivum TaxID=4565 RepID=A0A9R1KT49_WHEAT|nr:uncharacterized protein LOC123111860 [Triticum aestivum]KAF7065392.1 hypothetical protein CFC21_071497 [Triticum aestivum]